MECGGKSSLLWVLYFAAVLSLFSPYVDPLVYLISAETGLEQLAQLGISLILDLIIPRPSVVTWTILGAAPVLLIMQM